MRPCKQLPNRPTLPNKFFLSSILLLKFPLFAKKNRLLAFKFTPCNNVDVQKIWFTPESLSRKRFSICLLHIHGAKDKVSIRFGIKSLDDKKTALSQGILEKNLKANFRSNLFL